jgi:hypothetical protein
MNPLRISFMVGVLCGLALLIGLTLPVVANNQQVLRFVRIVEANPVAAKVRQQELSVYVAQLRSQLAATTLTARDGNCPGTTSMLRAFFIAEYYRFHGDPQTARCFYEQSLHQPPFPTLQRSLAYAPRDHLSADGNLLVENFNDLSRWMPDAATHTVIEELKSLDGITEISYPYHPETRQNVVYQLYLAQELEFSYHSIMALRVKMDPHLTVTIEAKMDGSLQRLLDHYPGNGSWQTVRVPLTGDKLQMLKLGFRREAQAEPPIPYTHHIQLDWVRLELAE